MRGVTLVLINSSTVRQADKLVAIMHLRYQTALKTDALHEEQGRVTLGGKVIFSTTTPGTSFWRTTAFVPARQGTAVIRPSRCMIARLVQIIPHEM